MRFIEFLNHYVIIFMLREFGSKYYLIRIKLRRIDNTMLLKLRKGNFSGDMN